MNTDYGKPVWDSEIHTLEHFRGYGLGMAGENQAKGKVSVEAMMTRIKIVMEGCDEKCTSTDLFLVAALAENGPGFNLDNMKTLQGKYGRINDGTHSLKWGDWLNDSNALSAKNQSTNRDLIAQFAGNVIFLENRGWDVPSDIDWSYVYSLTVTTVQP